MLVRLTAKGCRLPSEVWILFLGIFTACFYWQLVIVEKIMHNGQRVYS